MRKFTFILINALFVTSAIFAQTIKENPKFAFNALGNDASKAYVTTLQWCADEMYTGIGVDAPGTLAGAAEFDAADLAPYNGNYITEIHIGIADATVITTGRVAILTGGAASPVIAYEQAVTFVNGWNEILLTTPYPINSATPILVAYEVVATGGFPMGFDAGPAIAKGNYVNLDGLGSAYSHLTDLSATLTYNNQIRAVVDDEAGGAVIGATPSTLQFLGYVGEGPTAAQQVVIQGVSLTENISAVTAAPFEISADNATFSTSATFPSTGGTMYVRFVPAEAGQAAGAITLSSTGAADVTIDILAVTFDCTGAVTDIPYNEDFTSTPYTACWTVIDANNDGSTFNYYYSDDTQTDLIMGYSYSSTNNANDWLVSPILHIPESPVASFEYFVQGGTYPEKYSVYVITGSPDNYAAGTQVVETQTVSNTEPAVQTIDLTAYVGQDVYVGIKAESEADMWMLWIDNFTLNTNVGINSNVSNAVKIFPNPAQNIITISNAENSNIIVMNMMGQVVASIENASANQSIDISNLSAGTYFVNINGSVEKINIVK